MKRMPDFLIIGAPRSGTTSMYEGLRRHPDIFMPSWKEPGYFEHYYGVVPHTGPGDEKEIRQGIMSLEQYQGLFDEVTSERIVGEASTIYLSLDTAARAIREALPDVRLIVSLRHPADRAYSQYQQHVQQGREPARTFEEAVEDEQRRIDAGWGPSWRYVANGCYGKHLAVYFDLFPAECIHVSLYEDLRTDLSGLITDLYRFLGADASYVPTLPENINASGKPKWNALHNFLSSSHPVKTALKPLVPYRARLAYRNVGTYIRNRNLDIPAPINPATRNALIDVYREDILKLQALIDRDLSSWLTKSDVRP